MKIKALEPIPPSKRATAFLRNFIKEHDKGLKAIKTLADIKEIAEKHAPRCAVSCPNDDYKCEICMLNDLKQILQKINEVKDDNTRNI